MRARERSLAHHGIAERRRRRRPPPAPRRPAPVGAEHRRYALSASLKAGRPALQRGRHALAEVVGRAQPILLGCLPLERSPRRAPAAPPAASPGSSGPPAERSAPARRPARGPRRGSPRPRPGGRRARATAPPRRAPAGPSAAGRAPSAVPASAGSVTLRAKPWWKPSRAKFALKREAGEATRKSADNASPRPPPTAAPCTAATTGVVLANNRSACRYRERGSSAGTPRRAEVGARAEVLALRAQHDRAAVGVGVETLVGVRQLADQGRVEEVRPADLDVARWLSTDGRRAPPHCRERPSPDVSSLTGRAPVRPARRSATRTRASRARSGRAPARWS